MTSWVFGHQVIDMVGLVLHPLLFFAWMYVLTLTPVPAETYLSTLGLVGFYTSGLGYLVRPMPKCSRSYVLLRCMSVDCSGAAASTA